MSEKTAAPEKENAGLHLNTKSIIGICILLVVIMAFAGILTQVLPRVFSHRFCREANTTPIPKTASERQTER